MEYAADNSLYVCPADASNLDVVMDYAALRHDLTPPDITARRERSIWRYSALLPVEKLPETGGVFDSVGMTPLYAPSALGSRYGIENFWVKDESRNPTGSFKDRASAIVLAQAQATHEPIIVAASTGNAGAALAGLAAAIGQKVLILAPKTAPKAKVAQLLAYGAEVILVDGSYDDAFDLSLQLTETYGWYNRNTGFNPLTVEGKKTGAFELWEALKLYEREQPLKIFVSVGDGNIISGLYKGFYDLNELGWLRRMPQLVGVQSERSAAIANAFAAGSEAITSVVATTIADSISVNLPRDGERALRAVRATGGQYLTVSDEEILAAIPVLGSAGIFAEPAGAAAMAGMIKATDQGILEPDDNVVVINTGSGLKDINAVINAVGINPDIIEPELCALTRLIEEKGIALS